MFSLLLFFSLLVNRLRNCSSSNTIIELPASTAQFFASSLHPLTPSSLHPALPKNTQHPRNPPERNNSTPRPRHRHCRTPSRRRARALTLRPRPRRTLTPRRRRSSRSLHLRRALHRTPLLARSWRSLSSHGLVRRRRAPVHQPALPRADSHAADQRVRPPGRERVARDAQRAVQRGRVVLPAVRGCEGGEGGEGWGAGACCWDGGGAGRGGEGGAVGLRAEVGDGWVAEGEG